MFDNISAQIGAELVANGLLSQDEMDLILGEVRKGAAFDGLVVQGRRVSEKDFYSAVAATLKFPFIDLSGYRIDLDCLQLISSGLARRFCIFPLFKVQGVLMVAMPDPSDVMALDGARKESGLDIDPVVATRSEIQHLVDQYYGAGHSMGALVEDLREKEAALLREAETLAQTGAPPSDQPVVRLVNLLIEHAIREGASDIHIEPDLNTLRVRIRVDGLLHEVPAPPKKFESAVISRIKIMSHLNIAENRVPQDGRFSFHEGDRTIDVRASTVPTVHGENVALRILDAQSIQFELSGLGFSEQALAVFEAMIQKPYGMILVTGPTGSGKTTTLYAALRRVNTPEKNIVTIEDPVEYKLEMIRQIQVNVKAGLTFATGLRSIVRQDPDIILVGEIRDSETAAIAVQSALTGHLVFSTLHTNDASGAAVRLAEMGIEPFLITSSLLGVIAQRLVRRICESCRKPDEIPGEVQSRFGLQGARVWRGKGCRRCHQTGFRGRAGIFEILEMTGEIRELVAAKSPAHTVQERAVRQGMKTMLDDGLQKVRAGLTTLDEVLRVAQTFE